MSNNRKLLKSLQEDDRAKDVKDVDLTAEVLPNERVLGVFWYVKRDCFVCKKRHAKPCVQKRIGKGSGMNYATSTVAEDGSTCLLCNERHLPSCRVTEGEPPFTYTGADYFGPFLVKWGRSNLNRYGCVFTCVVARAIHIEIAHSLDTDSFVNASQRFISRRGQVKEMWSDNDTNLVGGECELREAIKEWNKDQIQKFVIQREIYWHVNPSTSSHMTAV